MAEIFKEAYNYYYVLSFFLHVLDKYTIALEKLGLHSLRKGSYYFDALFCSGLPRP
jgi:hypothetical protein